VQSHKWKLMLTAISICLLDMEAERSLLDLSGLLMELRELLGCPVNIFTEKGLRQRIRDRAPNI
ncbi:MAG: hypothetical protein AAGF66_18845, partial [Cyanobacteria bacterium P01_H01_bin.119]